VCDFKRERTTNDSNHRKLFSLNYASSFLRFLGFIANAFYCHQAFYFLGHPCKKFKNEMLLIEKCEKDIKVSLTL
jgi:hypothetical protein